VIGGTAFYCMSSGMYFLGAVGLINSLRLQGHAEQIFLLDCGLTAQQRELLSPHVTLVPKPDDREPFMLKTFLPIRHPAEVMVLIDADMVVTRPLTGLCQVASKGRVMAVKHPRDRFVSEWGELLGLGVARRHPYVSSALVFLGGTAGQTVIRTMHEAQDRIDFDRTLFRTTLPEYPYVDPAVADAAVADYPFFYADQDLLNAILATRVGADRFEPLDSTLVALPPFEGLTVVDEGSLRCAYEDGTEPDAVHHHTSKPWLEPTYHGVYSRLLRRTLIGPDLAVRVPERDLPLRLRRGWRAFAARARVNARERVRWHVREPLRDRVRALRGHAAGDAR
jgi:hypothetical protein